MRRPFRLALAILSTVPLSLAAQQSDVAISPFVTEPSGFGTRPIAGLALTLAGSPTFGLRGAARMALKNAYAGPTNVNKWLPPWGGDADALFALSGRPFGGVTRSASSFAFVGVGIAARDTADVRIVSKNWSYGLGATLPLGSRVDLFAESRWRVAGLILPTAHPRPLKAKEYWVGMSFHVGAGTDKYGRRR
jgi:hypothetical protein